MSTNGNTASVSLADGTSSPDLRVNYEFGLVLGVSEFQQEQSYFLQKDYLTKNAFHGYGTGCGLHVTAQWLKGEDVQITVSPGLAIDQFGRPVVVREAQCARLAAWLKKQEAAKAGTIQAHRDAKRSEHLRVYIIVRYDEYADALVPVAGQACNSGDTAPIPSRIRDSYTIDFAWDAPAMPVWESTRCFARLMQQVHILPDAECNDTDEILAQIRKLGQPERIPLCAPSGEKMQDELATNDEHYEHDDNDEQHKLPRWYIPTHQARQALDRIFTTWITEVRPTLIPDLLDTTLRGATTQPDILLAAIDFKLDKEWEDGCPKIRKHDFDPPDNSVRPFLLSTQVMQELFSVGHPTLVAGGEHDNPRTKYEFATIQVRNDHTLHAWIHYSRRLLLAAHDGNWHELLEVRSDGQPLIIARVTEQAPNFLEIKIKLPEEEPQGESILLLPGARVELIFKVDHINVERTDEDAEIYREHATLGQEIEEGVKKVERGAKEALEEAKDIIHEVEGDVEKQAGKAIEVVGKDIKEVGKALKETLGIGKDVKKEGAKIERAGERLEKTGQEQIVAAHLDEEQRVLSESIERLEVSLDESIRRFGLDFVGYNRAQKTIVVYTIAHHIPIHELVTFFRYDQNADTASMPHVELAKVTNAERFLALWFHTSEPVHLPQQVRILRVFVDSPPQEFFFRTAAPQQRSFSHFWALEPQEKTKDGDLVPGELVTVVFNTNEISVGSEEKSELLTTVLKATPLTTIGYDGNHTIQMHHQVSFAVAPHQDGGAMRTGQLPKVTPPSNASAPIPAIQPFVTTMVTRLSFDGQEHVEAHLECWFHLSLDAADDRIGFTDELTFDVFLEDGRQMRTTQVEATPLKRIRYNLYTSSIHLPVPTQDQRGYYLRLCFRLNANPVNVRGVKTSYPTLGDYINSSGIRFEGYNGRDAIIAYVRMPVPQIGH